MAARPRETVSRYFDALRGQQWDLLRGLLAEDVRRTGPYRDEVRGREAYVAFLARVLPSLPGYRLDVDAVTEATGGGVFAEIRETITRDGAPFETPELIAFELDADARIARVRVYIQQTPPRS